MLNISKTIAMNFNFNNNFQFSTRLSIDNQIIETISETKLLGVSISDTLSCASGGPNQHLYIISIQKIYAGAVMPGLA